MYPLIIYFWQWRDSWRVQKYVKTPVGFPAHQGPLSWSTNLRWRSCRDQGNARWNRDHLAVSAQQIWAPAATAPFNRIRQRLQKKTGFHSMVYLMNREIWIESVTQYVSVIRQLCFCSSFNRSALFAPHLPPTCPRWWPARWAQISYISYYPHESCIFFFGVDPVTRGKTMKNHYVPLRFGTGPQLSQPWVQPFFGLPLTMICLRGHHEGHFAHMISSETVSNQFITDQLSQQWWWLS